MSRGNIVYPVPKIDDQAVVGLTGVANSLAYKVHEIERHLHSNERWFAQAAAPAGETHVADRFNPLASNPFQVDAGNDTWGAWVQILGSSDTPDKAGNIKFDPHKIIIENTAKIGKTHCLQIAFGASGAAALAAGWYTEMVFISLGAVPGDVYPVVMQSRRNNAGQKVWARVFIKGENTGTVDFYYGIHEYEG